jgi:small-conductance mechanosensitive channel
MEKDLINILYDPTIGKIVTLLIGGIIIIIISRFIKKRIGKFIKENETKYKIRKIITFLTYLLVITFITIVFSDKLGGITVALGVAGAGIAFALQEVILSLAGWLAITFSNFYKIGDRVQVGGNVGDVIDIGLLRTTLMECRQWVSSDQYTGRIIRIANSYVFKDPVFNYSADFPFLWDEIKFPIRYNSNIDLTRKIIHDAAYEIVGSYILSAQKYWNEMLNKYIIEPAKVEPMIFLIANDNWLEFSLRYVVDYKSRRSTKDKLFTKIIKDIESTGSKVQIASSTFELVALPQLNIKTNNQ